MNRIDGTYKCCMSQDMHGSAIRRYGTLTLRSNGESLTGRMFPTMFWLDAPFSGGTVNADGAFFFTVHFATPCQQYAMRVEGRVTGDTLTGTVFSPMGDYRLEGQRQ